MRVVDLPSGATSEDQVHNPAGGIGRLDFEALFEPFEAVPEAFTAAEDDRHEGDVQVVDQVRLEDSGVT